MSVYVTVGSTGFDALIDTVTSNDFLHSLSKNGYTKLTIQHGTSDASVSKSSASKYGISVELFDYTAAQRRYIEGADLVVCHAGTGSILDSLGSKRPTIVVVNPGLMHNHQAEVAEELARLGYVVVASAAEVAQRIGDASSANLRQYTRADPRPVGEILDEEVSGTKLS